MTAPVAGVALDGWISHDGGPNPVPGKLVDWKSKAFTGRGVADRLAWGRNHLMPIIAYRIVPDVPALTDGEGEGLGPDLVAFTASDRACYEYPGVDDGPLRAAFVAGAEAYSDSSMQSMARSFEFRAIEAEAQASAYKERVAALEAGLRECLSVFADPRFTDRGDYAGMIRALLNGADR